MVAGVASRIAKQGFGQVMRRVGRVYLHTSFGTGVDTFTNSMGKSIFGTQNGKWYTDFFKRYKTGDWKNFGKHFKSAVSAVEKEEETLRKAAGGSYTKSLWEQVKGLWHEPKAAYKAAQTAGKSGLWGGIKGFGKAALKRFPLIGGGLFFLSSFGDIKHAFKEGGFCSGVWETVKSAAGVGIDMAGFAIGQALIPIPFVGGLIGSIVVGGIGRKILGKPWREKHAQEAEGSYGGGSFGGGGATGRWDNVENPSATGNKYQYTGWTPIESGLTKEQIMQLNRMYQQEVARQFSGIA